MYIMEITDRDYVDLRIDEMNRRLDERYLGHKELISAMQDNMTERAREQEIASGREHDQIVQMILKSESGLVRRLEAIDLFRDDLKEQSALFATRDQTDAIIRDYEKQIQEAKREASDKLSAHEDAYNNRLKLLESKLVELEKAKANMEGRIAMLGVVFTILVFAVNIGLRFLP
jgi:hypothetical protein